MHIPTSHRPNVRAAASTQWARSFAIALAVTGVLSALGACSDQPTATTPAHAASPHREVGTTRALMVTSNSGGSAPGTLAWAVQNALQGDTVRFDPGLAGDTIAIDSTLKALAYVTVDGPADKGITISGRNAHRIFILKGGATLRNLNIIDGFAPGASPIFSKGPLTLEHTTVARNVGGGAAIQALEVFLTNSTVSGNTGSTIASGIAYEYRLTLTNSTVAYNGPAPGIGEYSAGWAPIVVLRNSIVANNGNPLRNCKSTLGFRYEGMSLANDYSCGYTTGIFIQAPLLEELADNGGPTLTHAFDYRSPVLNSGASCSVNVDQRYVSRVPRCDIGAYEFTDFTTVTLTIDPNASVDAANGIVTVTGTAKCTRDGDQFGVTVDLEQEQKLGKGTTVVRGTGGTGIHCTRTTQYWSVSVGGSFDSGPASATASTNDPPIWVTPATVSSAVKLGRPRR